MDSVKLRWVLLILCVMVLWAFQGFATETISKQDKMNSGMIEVECNISGLELHLCPQEKYQKKETSVFFGLIKSEKHLCTGGEISLGETPVKPIPVPRVNTYCWCPKGIARSTKAPLRSISRAERGSFSC